MTGGGLSAVPDFGFAGACLVTWFRPTTFCDRMVHHIAMVMLLEFFVVHSAGFMGVVAASDQPRARRLLLMLGLAGLYTVFTGPRTPSASGPGGWSGPGQGMLETSSGGRIATVRRTSPARAAPPGVSGGARAPPRRRPRAVMARTQR
jgi:hypothetical protein